MKERLHVVGPGLFGIASLPEAGAPSRGPAMILLNAGLMHRSGPFRLYVELARRVAARGMLVFRFDQCGVGDGPSVRRDTSHEDQVAENVIATMDALTKLYGVTSFVLGGLCSGALDSHRVALRDPRVHAILMLDGYAYKTQVFYKQLVISKALKPASWPGVVSRVGGAIIHSLSGAEGAPPSSRQVVVRDDDDFFSGWPPIEQARRELRTLVDRGVEALFVFTGGWSSFVADEQFDEMFPGIRGRKVQVRFLPRADHTYVIRQHRDSMLRAVEDFAVGLMDH